MLLKQRYEFLLNNGRGESISRERKTHNRWRQIQRTKNA